MPRCFSKIYQGRVQAHSERSKGDETEQEYRQSPAVAPGRTTHPESSTDASHSQETGQPEPVAESAGHRRHGRGARRARHRLCRRRTPPAEHRHHPRRRPGIRRHGRVRQRDQDAEPRLAGERRRALHELLHARELLAHAIHAAERRRYAPERPGQHGRVDCAQPVGRGRLRRLPQQPGGHAAAAAQGCRLSHLHGRQVAPGQGA